MQDSQCLIGVSFIQNSSPQSITHLPFKFKAKLSKHSEHSVASKHFAQLAIASEHIPHYEISLSKLT